MEVQSLAMLANMLANKFNIDVKAEGKEAYCSHDRTTNKTHIVVPAFIEDNDSSKLYARGYIDHEIGHARFTDWDAMDKNNEMVQKIANVFEDVYVERMMGQCYPGCALNLKALEHQLFVNDRVYEKSRASVTTREQLITWNIFRFILYRSRGIKPLLDDATTELENIIPGLTGKLGGLLADRLPKCKTSSDNTKLAQDVVELLGEKLKEKHEEQNQTKSKTGGVSEQAANTAYEQNAKKIVANALKDIQSSLDVQSITDKINNILNNSLMNTLSRSALKAGKTDELRCNSTPLKTAYGMVEPMPPTLVNEAMGTASALSAQLQVLMQAKVLRKRRIGYSGRLDTNRLHRLAMNNPRVFLTNNEVRKTNTQVILLGDTSGSMRYIKTLASKALYVVMAALRNINGVQSAAFGFSGKGISVMSDFNQPLYQSKLYMAMPNGDTPGGSALQHVIQKFDMTKPELRKILFFITDGEFPDDEARMFKAVYREAQEVGIDIIGIGIKTNAVENLWKKGDFFVINGIRELAPKMFDLLKERLV